MVQKLLFTMTVIISDFLPNTLQAAVPALSPGEMGSDVKFFTETGIWVKDVAEPEEYFPEDEGFIEMPKESVAPKVITLTSTTTKAPEIKLGRKLLGLSIDDEPDSDNKWPPRTLRRTPLDAIKQRHKEVNFYYRSHFKKTSGETSSLKNNKNNAKKTVAKIFKPPTSSRKQLLRRRIRSTSIKPVALGQVKLPTTTDATTLTDKKVNTSSFSSTSLSIGTGGANTHIMFIPSRTTTKEPSTTTSSTTEISTSEEPARPANPTEPSKPCKNPKEKKEDLADEKILEGSGGGAPSEDDCLHEPTVLPIIIPNDW
ncbi:uncharacterized protein LOC132201870 [Neocloeon triangulifer]|uniref:uncharacterized protein LOC132201870 n=1 Tax=Neocloeon triangulifer TaxID=2078957 RepID=UPI00286F10AD|nr:uncharacterized protein LOC132201870 [Neocloeon triangulifer]